MSLDTFDEFLQSITFDAPVQSAGPESDLDAENEEGADEVSITESVPKAESPPPVA